MSGAFEKLLGELETAGQEGEALAKSLQAGEAGQEGAAGAEGAGAEAGAEGAAAAAGAEGAAAGAEAGDSTLQVTLANGDVVEAVDGTELVKALTDRLNTNEQTMGKAFEQVLGLVKGQASMIKSLNDKITALGGEGRGRKAVLNVHGKNEQSAGGDVGAGSGDVTTADDFMAKSEDAWKNDVISGRELNTIDVCLRGRMPIPQDLLSKVAKHKPAA